MRASAIFPTFRPMENNNRQGEVIYGRHPVVEAITAGLPVDKLWLQQGTRGEFEKEIRRLSKEWDIPVQFVPKEKLSKLAGGNNHQGIVGFLSIIGYQLLEDVLPAIYERSETPLIVVLDHITDVRNLGAIARSASCCGAHALVIPRKGGALINAEAMKASAGALARLPVCRVNSLVNAVEFLQQSGIQVLASDLRATQLLHQLDLTGPTALLLGAEGEGLHHSLSTRADQQFRIPQLGDTESFNVSVAAGIMLYESLRQRIIQG